MAGSPSSQGPPDPVPPHEPTLTSRPAQAVPGTDTDRTNTVTGADAGAAPGPARARAGSVAWNAGSGEIAGHPAEVIRHGPGVPVRRDASQAPPTAEQVWRTPVPGGSGRPGRLRRLAGPVLSVTLLVASGVVIYLRLHHGPFGVTGVVITQEVKTGCREDVTGRVSTTGAAGTVSYEWVFNPRLAAPRPLSENVAGGQDALYVTAAVEGQGHGTFSQTVTLQVLGPGQRSASAQVSLSC